MFPIMVDLANKDCVVIGGGKIAYRRTVSLLQSGATIKVISPVVHEKLQELSDAGKITIFLREAVPTDYEHAFLIIAATSSLSVNEIIARNARAQQLVNVASNHELGNFHIPATVQRGKLQIAISTGGASPLLAKKIRDELKAHYHQSYEDYVDFLFEARQEIIRSTLSQEEKNAFLKEILEDEYVSSTEKRNEWCLD